MTVKDDIETPIFEAPRLSAALGRSVAFKMECLQPSGSFKLRGVGLAVRHHAAQGARRLVSSSGGNAGLATAYAGRAAGLPVSVYVPTTTPPEVRALLAAYGAEVIVSGSVWDEADAAARQRCADETAAYIPPFDDPLLWEGHATLIDEAARQIAKPEGVMVSVGGGGLLIGVLQGMARNGWGDVPVYAVETFGAASYAAALAAGRPVRLEKITSVATTLGALQVAAEAVAWASRRPVTSVLVSDEDALRACVMMADHLRVLVEPACGAALAAVSAGRPAVGGTGPLLVIACGGAAVDARRIGDWRELTRPPDEA